MKRLYISLLILISIFNWIPAQNIYVDSSAIMGSCMGTLANPYFNLQDALTTASAGDTIFVAMGTYYPDERNCGNSNTNNRDTSFYIPNGVVVMGGYNSGFTSRDIDQNPTILSGDIDQNGMLSNNSYHVVRTKNVSSVTVVDGFTITGGNADDSSIPNNRGGGWYNDGSGTGNSSNPTIRNCLLSGNSVSTFGGAIFNYGNFGTSSPVLTNCVFSENSAEFGGAIQNYAYRGTSSPVLTNCVLSGNSAEVGGAIYNYGSTGDVGGEGESSPVLTNCVLSGNSAISGGAIHNDGRNSGISSPVLTNCVLSGNSAKYSGGAISGYGGGGGISSPVLTNCIFYQNGAGNSGPVFYNYLASPSISHSMFDVDYATLNSQCTNCVDTSAQGNKFSTDPLFMNAPLASAAPTSDGDFHMMPNSPAIDMGLNSANSESEDLDGLSRVYNGTIDMGAYEWRPYCLQDTVYLDENGEVTINTNDLSLVGELPEIQGCELDTIIDAPDMATCSDTAVLYTLYLIRDMSSASPDTIITCTDTIWILDTMAPIIDMLNMELAVNEGCMAVMPDLSIYVSDNCSLDTIIQSPEAGEPLGLPGSMVMVTLYARDSSENESSVLFDFEVIEITPTVPLNCAGIISPAINPDGTIEVLVNEIAPNANCLAVHDVQVLNSWGGVIWSEKDLRENDFILNGFDLCSYLGQTLEVIMSNGLGTCTTVLNLDKNRSLVMNSGLQPGRKPHIALGKINVYCGKVPLPTEYQSTAKDPCTGKSIPTEVQPDWIMPMSCDEVSDTAEVIFRTWEAYDKNGNLSILTDTIVVFRLPRLTPDAFVGKTEDSFYCELVAVPNNGQALKRYASWKQPVGLHDYELPYSKLRGLTYEIPGTIILAGLVNAYAQGPNVFDEYLTYVILRKSDGREVTIGDIVSGDYMADLIANATGEQLTYGFLQALIELNEKPLNVVLNVLFEFYPYLLLQEADWILSEGGNFEKVDSDWFFNSNGQSPYWFAGGWPSIYGSGDCISYCDVGAKAPGAPQGACIKIRVPKLTITGGLANLSCDTICLPPSGHEVNLPSGVHCGITIKQNPLTAWTGSCPKTRGVDSWITQTCWAETPNYCAEDAQGQGSFPCELLSADYDDEDVVIDYECTDKAIKIHLSQWQTLVDTIGPIFDFCHPLTTLSDFIFPGDEDCDISPIWDQDDIQAAIRRGEQYENARNWEHYNPTVYTTGSHDCAADVFVPSVQVIDNCSGVHSVKAMVDVKGGTRAVALERTNTEIRILASGDTCTVYTYSHVSNPIRVPFTGCDAEPMEVRYEAADNCWNQSYWSKFIKVEDATPPTVVMDRELTVSLSNKTAWMYAESIDEGSWDNCAIDLRLARRTDWMADTACVNLCSTLGPNAPYDNWVDLLDDLGVKRSDAVVAVGGGTVGAYDFHDGYNVNDLKTFLNDGEVEQYYFNQIKWLWEDEELCGEKAVHGWLYSIAAYIAENCSELDDHGNPLDLKDLEGIFDNLFDNPGYGREMAHMGGGWSKAVPFKCEDACEEVMTELLVMDYCCNWWKSWTTVHVEDKSPARLVKRLPDLDISCESYNLFYKDIVEGAAAFNPAGGSAADTTGVYGDLNDAFGQYIATWVDNQNRATDIDGNLLPDSELNFAYNNVTCEEKSETEKIAVTGHDGKIDWITDVTKTTYLDTAELTEMNGIIAINCAGSYEQDVWIDLDECGQGTIIRRFFVKGGCGPKAPSWEVEQVINVKSACGMRESMFDLPENVGTKDAPICLPEGVSESYLPDTLGGVTLKPHLDGALCNSIAIGSDIKELDVLGGGGMKKYIITWTVIDWCAPHTEDIRRQFTCTQEVIATIDPTCVINTSGVDTGDVSLVQGSIATELGEAVQKVEMKAVLGSGSPLTTVTSGDGAYSFSVNDGSQVSLVPSKNTGHANGVSTQDLVDIQRHVLQKKSLESKYQRIAADVNANGSIDGLDVLELRKLIMKPDSKFANNTSWRFYDTTTDKEVYDVANVNGDVKVDFVGVKIGDVNLSGDPARRSLSGGPRAKSKGAEVSSRSTTGNLHLNVADKTLKGGDVYRVDVTSDNFANITGLQYTLSYVTNLVEVESIDAGALNITKDNYYHYAPGLPAGASAQEGVITSSWSEADGQNLSSDVVLFTIVLKAKSEVQLRDALSLNSRVTTTEAYDAAGGLKDVSLRFDGEDSGFALYQNTPNPYAGQTVIGFKLPEASKATLSVYDVTGKVLKIVEGEYTQGYNEVQLKGSDLNATGVLYYQLDTKMHTATKKMVVIE